MKTPNFLYAGIVLSLVSLCKARKWNDTGRGTIVFEEAWTIPELLTGIVPPPAPGTALRANLLDIHNQRLAGMNANGVDFMVLSCASPCIQGISDPEKAAAMAVHVNDALASAIQNNTLRFGGFAALSMHNASVAAQELKRAVKDLGFVGGLVNDYQQSGADNNTLLFFDTPEYDEFWQAVTELDVPIYFHPRTNVPTVHSMLYGHSPWLSGPSQEFSATLSTHILGLCANGVFDRFPKVKVIVGHLGERIPSDLLRIDQQLANQKPQGMPMLLNASSYWRKNLFETTSGNFATDILLLHKHTIGLDRILYSIDYPFVQIPQGTAWIDGQELRNTLSRDELFQLRRGAAIRLLKLDEDRH